MKFIGAPDREAAEEDFKDPFVEKLQNQVSRVRTDREMGARYMLLEELMKDEFKAGKAEGKAEGIQTSIISVLSSRFMSNAELENRICDISDVTILEELLSFTIRAESLDEFVAEMQKRNL